MSNCQNKKDGTFFINCSTSSTKYWIKIHRNNQYIPHIGFDTRKNLSPTLPPSTFPPSTFPPSIPQPQPPPPIQPLKPVSKKDNDMNGWHLVKSGKKNHKIPKDKPEKTEKLPIEQPIYYWVVSEHNLFNKNDESCKLFFTEPDTTQIENIDRNNYMAIDKNKELHLIHVHLKHKGMKMTPTYFIARNLQQIEDALHFVKYCVVRTDNNEQKIVELE